LCDDFVKEIRSPFRLRVFEKKIPGRFFHNPSHRQKKQSFWNIPGTIMGNAVVGKN
jgi:hypothetical protein